MKIKYTTLILIALLSITGLFVACSDDDDPEDLAITSITLYGTRPEAATLDIGSVASTSDVPLDPEIHIVFSAPVDPATITTSNIYISNASVSLSANGETVIVSTDEYLTESTTYTFTITDAVKGADGEKFEGTSRNLTTVGADPNAEGMTAYWKFDGNATEYVSEVDPVVSKVGYTSDRFGVADGAALFSGSTAPGNGDVLEYTYNDAYFHESMTISFWYKADSTNFDSGSKFVYGLGVERGYFLEMHKDWIKLATSHVINPDPGAHGYGTAWTDPNGDGNADGNSIIYEYQGSMKELIMDNEWHQLVLTFDASNSVKTFYLDGEKIRQDDLNYNAENSNDNDWYLAEMGINETDGLVKNLTFGYAGATTNTATGWADYSAATNTFVGSMDDFRIYDRALSETKVQNLYNAEKN